MIITLITQRNCRTDQMDVKSAVLNGGIDGEVYMDEHNIMFDEDMKGRFTS